VEEAKMVDRTMQGVYPILSLPSDAKGQIDYEDLQKQVEWFVECGVHGIGIAMATEVYKLTDGERDKVLKTVVKQNNGRAKVVMNTGAEGTDVAIAWSKRAEELGADALMIRPVTYVPPGSDQQVEYFVRIAKEINIPVFLQDQSTAPVPPGLAVRCAKAHPNLCYVKVETPPTSPRMAEANALRGDSGLVLFGGAGGAFVLEEFRRGSVGTMPGSTLPDMFVRVWDLWQDGSEKAAEAEFHRYAALIRTLGQGMGVSGYIYKHIMWRRGVFKRTSTVARHPALPATRQDLKEVDQLLDELELV
jgi:4-hydroxy-tetrahydrodipicolinate synthase